MALSDEEIDRLLKGTPVLRALRRERTREAGLEYSPKPRRTWYLALGFPKLAVAALALFVLVPTAYWGLTRNKSGGPSLAPLASPGQEFTSRGTPLKQPSFKVWCLAASGAYGPCAPGSTMVFRVTPVGFRAFAAFAQGPDGNMVWYFPGEEQTTSLSLVGLHESGMLPRGVPISDSDKPGTYLIHGIFSSSPLTKDQVREAVSASPSQAVVDLKQALTIERR